MTQHTRYCDRHGHLPAAGGTPCLNCGAPLNDPAEVGELDPEGASLIPPLVAAFQGDDKPETAPRIGLPTDYDQRKSLPIFDGCIMYFPLALLAVSEVSRLGNEQHNPGEPLHWARGKSMDQYNTCVRHLMDHRLGGRYDTDGGRHLAKAAWRALAALQLDIEQEALESAATDSKPK
jgi:hypothetical protein